MKYNSKNESPPIYIYFQRDAKKTNEEEEYFIPNESAEKFMQFKNNLVPVVYVSIRNILSF